MNLAGKVPVEQLSDERLTNIERNLVVRVSEMRQQPSRAPRRMLAFAGIAAAVAVAAFVGWKLHRDPALPPAQPQQLAMKDGVLDLGDAQIAGTDFEVARTATRTDVVMKPGRIELHVDHDPGRLFVVRAGDVEIEDIGTRFSVDYDGKHVDVRVTEGEVKVKHAGKEHSIKAGGAWDLELGPITIAQLTAQQAAAANGNATPNVATPAQPATGGPSAGNTSSTPATGTGSGSATKAVKLPSSDGKKAVENFAIEPLVPASAKDPKTAIAEYREMLKTLTEGEDKAEVLQSIAVMYVRLKNDREATHLIQGILQRMGGDSPAFKEALWLDLRIKCLTSYGRDDNRDGKPDRRFDDTCRLAADKYLAKFPNGTAAGVAQQVRNEISRGQ